MSTLATLMVGLGIDTRDFEQGISRAEQKSQELNSGVKSASSTMLGFVGAMAGMAVASGLFTQAKDSIIGMNATLESSTLQFTTLTHDADFAAKHIQDLFKLGAATPFESQSLINASAAMETFGGRALDTENNLILFGDAAAATNLAGKEMSQQLQDITFWSSRMYAALQAGKPIGEAIQNLQQLGAVSPQVINQLEAMKKSGATGAEMWKVYTDGLQRFSGAMQLQSQTWQGLSSSISDNAKMLVATAFRPLFDEGKKALTGLLAFLNRLSEGGGAERFADRLRFVLAVVGEFGARMLAYARMAVGWGANIGNQLAAGLSSAIAGIVSVLRSIGSIIASWLRPGSPPKITPNLDKWGQEAGQLYLDSWSNIDYDSLSAVGSTIQDTLHSLADVGQFPTSGVIPAVLAGRDGFAKIINDLPLIGDVAGSTFDDIVRAMGPAGQQVGAFIRAYANLVRATREVENAQNELNQTTAKYDAMLKPLNAEMQALQDREAEIRQNQQLERDYKTLADTSADASEKALAQNDIEQIMLSRKIKGIDKEKVAAVDAAQEKLDAAKAQQATAQAQVDQQKHMIDATNEQNKLIKQQVDLMKQMVKAQSGTNVAAENAKAAQEAQWQYNFAMQDGAGKLKMLQDKLATLNPSQAEYWQLLGQINDQQQQNARDAETQMQASKDLAQAQWDHNFAVADAATKMQMLKDKLATLNPAQQEYWQTLTQIDQLQDQMNAKAAAGGKGVGGLGAIGASATDALGPISTFSQAAADMQAKIDAIDIKANNFAENIQTKFEGAFTSAMDVIKKFGNQLYQTFGPAIDSTIERFNTTKAIIKTVFDDILQTGQWFKDQFITDNITTWNSLVDTVNTVISKVNGIITLILGQVLLWLQNNGKDVAATFFEVWHKISGIVNDVLEIIRIVVSKVFDWIKSFIDEHQTSIQTILDNSWKGIKGIINLALDLIGGIVKAALDLLKGDWQGALKTLEDTGKAIWEDIKQILRSALDNILVFFGTNLDDLQAKWSKMWDDAVMLIKKTWNDIKDKIQEGINTAVGYLAGFTKPFDDINKAIEDTIGWVQRFIDKLTHIEIPDILQQHSPSMFEQSILDVGDAFGMATDASNGFNSAVKDTRGIGINGAANSSLTTGGSAASRQFVINIDARGSNWTEDQFKEKVLKTLDGVVNGASNADRFAGLGA